MQTSRWRFLRLAAGRCRVAGCIAVARAQAYPSRPVRIIVGFLRPNRRHQRTLAGPMALGPARANRFVIENFDRAPAVRSLLSLSCMRPRTATRFCGSLQATTSTRHSKPIFPDNFIRDIEPVASSTRSTLVAVVNPSVPVKTVPELIGYAKANPGKLQHGVGRHRAVSTHLAGESFKMMTGIEMFHVPHPGSAPALTDLISGQVQVMFDLTPSSIGYIRAGQLRALAVTTATRSGALPEAPTIGEFVPGYEASAAGGIGAPKGTPVEIIQKLNTEINAVLSEPDVRSRYASSGSVPNPGRSGRFRQWLIAAET